jgi:hypothetical protein
MREGHRSFSFVEDEGGLFKLKLMLTELKRTHHSEGKRLTETFACDNPIPKRSFEPVIEEFPSVTSKGVHDLLDRSGKGFSRTPEKPSKSIRRCPFLGPLKPSQG